MLTKRTANGFKVEKSPVDIAREERLKRIEDRKKNPKANPTNRDIADMLNDLFDELADLKKS